MIYSLYIVENGKKTIIELGFFFGSGSIHKTCLFFGSRKMVNIFLSWDTHCSV